MESPESQQLQQVNEKNNDYLFVKVFQLFSKGGIKILDEHKELVSGFPETNSDGSAEAKADSQDKSALSISGADHNKHVDILHIAAAYVDEKNFWRGETPLHLAARTEDTELVDLFLKAGADVGAEDILIQTPLHLSAGVGHKKVFEVLLKAGANVNAADYMNQTPLHLSAMHGHKEGVEVLLKAGAKVNAPDIFKQTPLHISAEKKNDDIFELLLRAGASVNDRDKWGYSVLDYMDDELRVRLGLEPRTLFKLRNWMYSLTTNKKHKESSTSSKTKTEHTETISARFTDLDTRRYGEIHTFPNEDSCKENGQDDTSRGSSTLLTSGRRLKRSSVISSGPGPQLERPSVTSPGPGPQLERPSVTSLGPGPQLERPSVTSPGPGPQLERPSVTSLGPGPQLERPSVTSPGPGPQLERPSVTSPGPGPQLERPSVTSPGPGPQLKTSSPTTSGLGFIRSPPPPGVSHHLVDDSDLQELNNIRQQVENHWATFSPETTEGCEKSCSSEVKAAQEGRLNIYQTTNITVNKITKNTNINNHHYEPGASLNIGHAENVALGSQTVVQSKKVKGEDDDDDSFGEDEHDSSSAEDTNNYT